MPAAAPRRVRLVAMRRSISVLETFKISRTAVVNRLNSGVLGGVFITTGYHSGTKNCCFSYTNYGRLAVRCRGRLWKPVIVRGRHQPFYAANRFAVGMRIGEYDCPNSGFVSVQNAVIFHGARVRYFARRKCVVVNLPHLAASDDTVKVVIRIESFKF